jgi:hypothetical protein
MFAGATNQPLFAGGPWSAVFFAIGIGALLWVFRRMILLNKRDGGQESDHEKSTRLLKAREMIAEVEVRAWLSNYRRSVKIPRWSPLGVEQRRLLERVTARQHSRGRQ